MNPLRGIWSWFSSRTVREAVDQHRIIRRLLAFQRDLLPPGAVAEVHGALDRLNLGLMRAGSMAELTDDTAVATATARRWLSGVDRRRHREFAEVLLLAAVIVLTFRTFFLAPMKIPTASMQPTLFGITAENLKGQTNVAIPTGLDRWVQRWVSGRSFYHVVAQADGVLRSISAPEPAWPWLPIMALAMNQPFQVGDIRYTVESPPAELPNVFTVQPTHAFFAQAGLMPNQLYRKGEDLIRMVVNAGDHVLVDRFTYNFRRPRRGEIIVFRTRGMPGVQEGTYYLKRLVALGNERVRLGNDRHLRINGVRLNASTPHFENVYGFSGPPAEGEYGGHVNDEVARRLRIRRGTLAPRFPDEATEWRVRSGHCLVMGDNTLSSQDGRYWGDFAQERVVGRYWMVYWPMSARFGWTVR